jgi:hypothetical protein
MTDRLTTIVSIVSFLSSEMGEAEKIALTDGNGVIQFLDVKTGLGLDLHVENGGISMEIYNLSMASPVDRDERKYLLNEIASQCRRLDIEMSDTPDPDQPTYRFR